MTNERMEIPRPQWCFADVNLQNADAYELFLRRTFEPIKLQFKNVKSVIDLYCGNGTLTLGSLLVFPNAQIHAIDYHKVLVPDAKKHPRVKFHQGWVSDVLARKSVPRADIVLVSYAGRLHGLNEANISLLSAHVGQCLFTVGDNYDLEGEPWFRKTFQFLSARGSIDGCVWTVK